MKNRRLFKKGFRLRWDAIESWAITNVNVANVRTGAETPMFRILELHFAGGIEHILTDETGGQFDSLVEQVRRYRPGRETGSWMEQTQKLRALIAAGRHEEAEKLLESMQAARRNPGARGAAG